MKLSDILSALPTLTQTELATVWAAADQLATAQENITDTTQPLYDALCQIINVKISYRDFCSRSYAKQWRIHAPAILAFIAETWPESQRSKVIRLGLMTLLIEALRDDLKSRNIPIALGVMVNNLGSIPECFENSFPDYIKSGMAHLILKSMRNQKGKKNDKHRPTP